MKDVFDNIHKLSQEEKYRSMLDLLLTSSGASVQSPYDTDINHAWYLAGDAYFRLGDFQQAVSAFKKAKESWGEDRDSFLALANSYSELGLPEKSEEVLREGLKIWQGDEEFSYNLGNALFDRCLYRDAIACYQSVVENPTLISMAENNIKAARRELKKAQRNRIGKARDRY